MYDLSCGFSQINNYALFKNEKVMNYAWGKWLGESIHILPYFMFENAKLLYKVARKFQAKFKVIQQTAGVILPSINFYFLKSLWWHFQKSHRPKKKSIYFKSFGWKNYSVCVTKSVIRLRHFLVIYYIFFKSYA